MSTEEAPISAAAEEHYLRLAESVLLQLKPDVKLPENNKLNIIRAYGVLNPTFNLTKGEGLEYPSYPNVPPEIKAKLILNHPVGEGLTKKERHQWLMDGAKEEVHKWLLRDTGLEARSIVVARWLLKVLANEEMKAALYLGRRGMRLSDHTIDLVDDDCQGGVLEAIARRADRMAIDEFGEEQLCKWPKWLSPLRGRVNLLDTASKLAREGREMRHCVGGYSSAVKEGRSFIISIRAWHHRATVEFSPQGKLVQMKAKGNVEASEVCKKLVELALSGKYDKRKDTHERPYGEDNFKR
jgi:hypothetical protein